jgi:hypothetical protein
VATYFRGMQKIDLEPGDYTERKPKGWRWRLPWHHPEDTKLPMVGFFVMAAFGVYFFLNVPAVAFNLSIGLVTVAFFAGACMVLWLRD